MNRQRFVTGLTCPAAFALLLAAAGCAGTAAPRQAATPAKTTATAAAPAAPATHTVARGALKAKLTLDAVFESTEMVPVKLEPKAWTDLTVLEAVPHGARVKKGDVLVKLDTEKLRDQIEDLEKDQPAATLALELGLAELENLEQTTPLKLEAARRAHRIAGEDLAYFENVGRAQQEKGAAYNLKGAEQRLEYAREELKQLEKMYKADDLTEETEEIILKRQKYSVEFAEYGLETTRLSTELSLKTSIPRQYEALKASKRDQDHALALSEQSLPRTLAKKRLDVEKLKRDQRKAEKRLADLKKDLENLAVRAPAEGVVYYGACEGGKWLTGATVAKKLIPTSKLTPNEIFMTIVSPDKLLLKAVVPENELGNVRPGLTGKAAPVSAPDKKLNAKLDSVGQVPLPGGGFEAVISFEKTPDVRLVPGMNCKVSLGEGQKADALLAPKEAVLTEAGQSCVFLAKGDAKPERRVVKTGASDDKMIEILEGLAAGDKILLKKPE